MRSGEARDVALLLNMVVAAKKATSFVDNVSIDSFEQDEQLQLALGMLVQIIGEAANGVSAEMQDRHPEIPWHKIVGMRHRLAHDYMRVDITRIWDTVQADLPVLITTLEPLIPPEN